MDKAEVLTKIKALSDLGSISGEGLLAASKQLIRSAFGSINPFYDQLDQIPVSWPSHIKYERARSILEALRSAVELEVISSLSYEKRIQIDVISDYLEQANKLLNTKDIHPAAAVILIGASLEEFLRNWCEEEEYIPFQKDGIDSFSKYLREKGLLNKQDSKDITAWAGIRNDAAHGHWSMVQDRERILLMLESVNHFMRSKISYTA